MNRCATCQGVIPDKHVACPACAMTQSRVALRKYQHHPLRELIDKRGGVFRQRMIGPVRHVQMWGCEYTYCWVFVGNSYKRDTIDWEALFNPKLNVCAKCREQVTEILEEARAWPASD